MERCFWIDIKYATFGILSQDGIVVDAPPIARWMVSKRLVEDIKPWLLLKGAIVKEIKGRSDTVAS